MEEPGTVQWFNAGRGYGFIQRQPRENIVVHFSSLCAEGYGSLQEANAAEFEVKQAPKGLQAGNVVAA